MIFFNADPESRWKLLRAVLGRAPYSLIFSLLVCIPMSFGWHSGLPSLMVRVVLIGLAATLMFTVFEQWPRRMPVWFARWVLQVMAVALTVPMTAFLIYVYSTAHGAPPFWEVNDRLEGFGALTFAGVLFSPWIALTALVRQKDALARHQALAFDLERSELARQASNARLHLLQAQVAPHFLFNTLANVQALVDAGSPRASALLRSLVAYLRAAVPSLNEPTTTVEQELQLVEAYLDLMHMRMPDRLQYTLNIDDAVRMLHCPPMTMLTLVENAVQHGIDPSEEGGRIEITATMRDEMCVVRVIDTGVGLRHTAKGLGTGLSTLRERLKLNFGTAALLQLSALEPHGVCAHLEFPIRSTLE